MRLSTPCLASYRRILMAAVGLSIGCGPAISGPGGSGTDGSGGSSDSEAASDSGASGASTTASPTTTTAGSTSGGSSASGSDSGLGSTGDVPPPVGPCEGGEEIMQIGDPDVSTGYVLCPTGAIQRLQPATCVDPLPAGKACAGDNNGECTTDADCTAAPFGRCVTLQLGGGVPGEPCGCTYGCASDDDCGEGLACACGGMDEMGTAAYPLGSQCIAADCIVGEDCEFGVCGMGSSDSGCGVTYKQACQGPTDACHSSQDCENSFDACFPGDLGWQCESIGACGRPLIVEGRAVTAPIVAAGRDTAASWIHPEVAPRISGLSLATRRALAEHWGRAAQFEHASVASFARFCQQLIGMGAPPDLLTDAIAAMADETDHARRCFALTSVYAGRPLGPGPMPSPEGEPAADREAIVAAIVEEACVAETLAAIEAQHAAGQATDPAVAETLRTIADDELRHAILGWRALAWALRDASPTMRVAAQAAFERAKAMAEAEALRAPTEGDPTQLRAHGVLASADRLALTRQALRQVVEPCFCDLLA